MKSTKQIFILIFLICSAGALFAQGGKALGLGGMTAISRGVESIYWNPANLAYSDSARPDFEMVIYSIFAKGGNNSFSFNDVNKYIGDGESIFLTDKDVKDILKLIPNSGMVFDLEGDVSVFSFRYKNFGFGIQTQAFGKFSIPKDLYENMLYQLGSDVYDYSIEGGGQGIVKFKFSYGRRLIDRIIFDAPGLKNTIFEEIAWGASISLIQGVGYANVEKGLAKLSINQSGILPQAEFATRTATLGKGLGVDFGISAYTNNHWLIGMTFENLLGSVFWSHDTEMSRASIDFGDKPLYLFGEGQLSEIDVDSVSTDTTYALNGFSKRIPFNFRFGMGKQLKNYLVNAEFSHAAGISQFVIGGTAKFSFFNLFASVGRRLNNFQWSAGAAFDFKHFYFDLGIASRGGITLASSKALSFGTSMRIGF